MTTEPTLEPILGLDLDPVHRHVRGTLARRVVACPMPSEFRRLVADDLLRTCVAAFDGLSRTDAAFLRLGALVTLANALANAGAGTVIEIPPDVIAAPRWQSHRLEALVRTSASGPGPVLLQWVDEITAQAPERLVFVVVPAFAPHW